MAQLELALLGPFQATLNGECAKGLNSPHLRALLAYLAVEGGRQHARQGLAALLWPERPDREALSALRNALSNLRGALGDRPSDGDLTSAGHPRAPSLHLLVTRTTLQFNPASDHWLDVTEFEALRGRSDAPSLHRAAALYRGPFLNGLSVGDSPAFDEWMLLKDEAYRRRVLAVLGRLASLRLRDGDYGEGARLARREIELEPYAERGHRQLMMALALSGERTAALVHYGTYCRLLAEELGSEPDHETEALYARIREGRLSRPRARPQPSPTVLAMTRPSALVADAQEPSCIVARERELGHLDSLLERALAGSGGVALISGEAGSGKTALAHEFARRATQAHGDLIALWGRCSAHAGAGDPYLPFREMLQTLAGDVESKRAGGTLSLEQARRAWAALPAVGAALVAHGPDLLNTFVPGEQLLRRVEGFPSPLAGHPARAPRWRADLHDLVQRGQTDATPVAQPDLFAQVTDVLHSLAVGRPLLLLIDDLQWADGGTAALLFHLGRRLAGSRILLACAYRPEALRQHADFTILQDPRGLGTVIRELRREWGDVLVELDEADGQAFVEAYIDSEPNRLRPAFRQALYDHTGGNPLFTVELLRSFQRDGTLVQDEAGQWVKAAGPDWARRPPRVEAVIAGHMAGLQDEDGALLHAASVQGEEFIAEVAARVLGWDEEAAVRRLSGPLRTQHRLVEAVTLERLASSGQRLSHYRFRHALLQQSAYARLDAVARARLHEATARALETIYAAEGEHVASEASAQAHAMAPTLARHYEAAGIPLEAARQRLTAGQWAVQLVAYDEAIAHLQRGLALLKAVPMSRERLHLELDLCTAISTPAMLQRGWGAPVHAWALERLSDLSRHPDLQDDPRCLTALSALVLSSGWSADPERSGRVGNQLLSLAQEGDRQSLVLAHWALGFSHWLPGQLVTAREHLEQALALYDLEANRPLRRLVAADPGVMAQAMLGSVLWLLGYAGQGRAGLLQAVAQAEALDHPSSAAFAHWLAATMTFVVGRDVAAALHHAEALRSLGQVSLVYGVWAELVPELAKAQEVRTRVGTAEGELEHGVARAVKAGSTWQSAGSGTGYVCLLLAQAEMHARAGQPEMGLETMDRAQAWIERTGVRILEADTWRMRAELLLMADDGRGTIDDRRPTRDERRETKDARETALSVEAETCFQRALAIAREQEARWLELRAAVTLGRLWSSQGRRAEARELLSGVYGWFTEGFNTPDLKQAKSLLEALSS